MRKEIKTVVYDDELRLEAYRFEGVVQPFSNHFHEYYVIGFVEGGERCLSCRNQEYTIGKGNVILFNPGDSHACIQTDDGTLDYRGFNITKEVMLDLAEEVTGKRELPGFSQNVICDEEITCYLRPLHELVMNGLFEFGKEESLLFMLSLLIQRYGQPFEECIPECREEIEQACAFYGGTLYRTHLFRPDMLPCWIKQIYLVTGFHQIKRSHSLLLFGKYPYWSSKKIVRARSGSY